ncbi:LysM peptidoglycan-binding domain-containing protein [uncultured Enterovirga sp.]|uniref:LysM peptidoglycan-binding domain-containing protein n=1 Tax=uncultured Enterovirga sp. TaxID=2026352 RepID=UPI0035CB828C
MIAGRAAPGAGIVLLVDGRPFAKTVADPVGLFAFVPPPIPPGSHEIVLEAPAADGSRVQSTQSVTVVIADNRREAPLVTVTKPGEPVVVLSRPEETGRMAGASPAIPFPPGSGPSTAAQPRPVAAAPPSFAGGMATPGMAMAPAGTPAAEAAAAAGPARPTVKIASVESEGSGRLYVSGTAKPGATVRLYLSESFVAAGVAEADGRVAFSIERGIRPGAYRVRLDEVDPASGAVASRVEVAFTAPPAAVASAGSPPAGTGAGAIVPGAAGPGGAAAGGRAAGPAGQGSATPAAAMPGSVPPAGSAETPANPGASAPTAGAAGPAPALPSGAPGDASSRPNPVVVPQVNTTVVSRGDSLWEISRRAYGDGVRYTVIYGANALRIRDPNLIYPGQVFVLPGSGTASGAR